MKTEQQQSAIILVVDDNPMNLQVLIEHLKASGYRTLVARSGEGALRQMKFAVPDLILLDVMMPPGIDGFETCRRLKADSATKDVPVIFLTALSDSVDKVKGIQVGGVDYVTKPFDGMELLARVRTHLELCRYRKALKFSNDKLQKANEALMETQKQLELAARIDSLTQLSNRRDMLEKLQYEKIRFERNQRPFALVLCDIDNFKTFNDTYGHDCGDAVLVAVSRTMRTIIRKQDQVARWGGEEFLFLLPETELEGARVVSEKLREKIEHTQFHYNRQILYITMTFGVSVFDEYDIELDNCIKRADQALYQAKLKGRNRVAVYEP